MPIDFRIHPDKQLVHTTATERVVLDDLLTHLGRLSADGRYIAPMKQLVDLRACKLDLDATDILSYSMEKSTLAFRFADERCAVVVDRDLEFGLCRMHQAQVEAAGITIRVFRELEAALAWLAVELVADEAGTEIRHEGF